MKIQVKETSSNGAVLVQFLSWQERCEKQLAMINQTIENINESLRAI